MKEKEIINFKKIQIFNFFFFFFFFSVGPAINIAVNSHLETSTVLSFSNNGDKTVVITVDGIILAIGDNNGCKITGSLPREDLTKFTKIEIKNGDSIQHPISAVCGIDYALYMVSPSKMSNIRRLAYSCRFLEPSLQLFLNIGNWKTVSLFGGEITAAAIGEGSDHLCHRLYINR